MTFDSLPDLLLLLKIILLPFGFSFIMESPLPVVEYIKARKKGTSSTSTVKGGRSCNYSSLFFSLFFKHLGHIPQICVNNNIPFFECELSMPLRNWIDACRRRTCLFHPPLAGSTKINLILYFLLRKLI